MGKTGILCFGHATFFGAGAYGAAIISTQLGLNPAAGAWIGLAGGVILAALVALIVGYFLIFGIPPLLFPTANGMRALGPMAQYWFLISVVIATTAAVWLICRGRYGSLLSAIEDDEFEI